jgi:hypothetical protein
VLTVLGIILMAASWIAWVHTEDRRMRETVERLRAADTNTGGTEG